MPCTTLFDVQGGTKPRKAGFENLTGNVELPCRDCSSCPSASFFHEICTAASPASGKLLRNPFPWGMTTNWNVRRWNFMHEILKTCFPWFYPTLYYFIYSINLHTVLLYILYYFIYCITLYTWLLYFFFNYICLFPPFFRKRCIFPMQLTLFQIWVGQSQPPPPQWELLVPSNFEIVPQPQSSDCWQSLCHVLRDTDPTWLPLSWRLRPQIGNLIAHLARQQRYCHKLTCSGLSVTLHHSYKNKYSWARL